MIDAVMDMMHAEQKVDVFEFVSRIRSQRPQMVQTDVSNAFPSQPLSRCELHKASPRAVSPRTYPLMARVGHCLVGRASPIIIKSQLLCYPYSRP